MEKISVIVPFHNVEKYIDECLESLWRQTYERVEVLCIDDCSGDGSREIAEYHAARDSRFRIVSHSVNKGLGGARNTGLAHASGELVGFVDSDDYVSHDFLSRLHGALTRHDADLAVCGFQTFTEPGKPLRCVTPSGLAYDLGNAPEAAVRLADDTRNATWLKLYRRDLLEREGLRQPEHRYFEDVVFWVRAALGCRRIATIDEPLYWYRVRPGSIMTTFGQKHIADRIAFIDELLSFFHDEVLVRPHSDRDLLIANARKLLVKHIRYGFTLVRETRPRDRDALLESYARELKALSTADSWQVLLADCPDETLFGDTGA